MFEKLNMRTIGKKLVTVSLAVSMIFTTFSNVFAATTTFDETALKGKVNPVLQDYDVTENKVWQLSESTRLIVHALQDNLENERLKEVVKLVNAEYMDKGTISNPLPMVYGFDNQLGFQDIFIDLIALEDITTDATTNEAYKIIISDKGVELYGASENAIMYGLRTIQSLMITNNGLPYGTIIDYPDVEERRLHLDMARKYISADWIIQHIRELSYLKFNTLQLHFSENMGFRIECKTDPSIVSDQYVTQAEIKEILAEANKYGIKIIPSFDSPGHVDQILRAHPEFRQVGINGERYNSGLDVTNPEAVAYIRSLYDEYMELFKGCTDFHIGGDEYMEFDRAPFTTVYQPVLNQYARETIGSNATWKDVMSKYINDLAEYVYNKGFKPRIWNDGIYYGESYQPQSIVMHKYIGIDFWSQMSWNRSIANLQTFINKGHEDIYNINASYFYYVLRGNGEHSFDYPNQEERIYNTWTPGIFQENTISDTHEVIKGASMAIWCDYADVATEEQIAEDIYDELRSLGSKSWNVDSPNVIALAPFQANYALLGHVAGYTKGSDLPHSGEFLPAGDVGSVTIKFVDKDGNTIKDDMIKYGLVDDSYEIEIPKVYGYRLTDTQTKVTGQFKEDGIVYTCVFELYTDKTDLQKEVTNALKENECIKDTYSEYKTALEEAKTVLANTKATQQMVDEVYNALIEAKSNVVLLKHFALYAESYYPLADKGYTSGYDQYIKATEDGKKILKTEFTQEDYDQALKAIEDAKANLFVSSSDSITIESTLGIYTTYYKSNMLDGNLNTKAWFNGDQAAGQYVQFNFANPVDMSKIQLVQPTDVGDDIIVNAKVQVLPAGSSEWKDVGVTDTNTTQTFEFDKQTVNKVRILLTEDKKNWYQISEVLFTYETVEEDHTLENLLKEAQNADMTNKEPAAISAMVDAYIAAQQVYANHGSDDTVIAGLQKALETLANSTIQTEKPFPFEDVFKGQWY